MNVAELTILLVDDDDIDAEAFQRAITKRRIANPIFRAQDGEQALEFLRLRDRAAPLLILLDLNMPRMNGVELLQEIDRDENLHGNTIFVFTSSDDDYETVHANKRHIAGYIMKSRMEDDFIHLLESQSMYWRYVVHPPTR